MNAQWPVTVLALVLSIIRGNAQSSPLAQSICHLARDATCFDNYFYVSRQTNPCESLAGAALADKFRPGLGDTIRHV